MLVHELDETIGPEPGADLRAVPVAPAGAAVIDEIRHLAGGSSIVKEHVVAHPQDRGRLEDLVGRGQEPWGVPVLDMLGRRGALHRAGSGEYRDATADHRLRPGRRTVDERIARGRTRWAGRPASPLTVLGLTA